MVAPVNLNAAKKHYLKNKKTYRHFVTKTQNNPPVNLDEIVDEVDRQVWAEVDCLTCANCCKKMSPKYTFQDVRRIAAHLNMKIKDFKAKWLYLNKKDNDWMNVSTPCQFLDLTTNMCTIYEVRPLDCASFPHLNKKKAADFMHIHNQNIEYCPATLKFVEKLKATLRPAL